MRAEPWRLCPVTCPAAYEAHGSRTETSDLQSSDGVLYCQMPRKKAQKEVSNKGRGLTRVTRELTPSSRWLAASMAPMCIVHPRL